jgi:hypothetical protein
VREAGHSERAYPQPTTKRRVDRDGGDFYPTPAWVTEALCGVERFEGGIWEPACGDGAMARVLERAGHHVQASDLHDRGWGSTGQDFLSCGSSAMPNIVTNPPYHLAEAFTHHAIALATGKVCLLLRLAWLEGVGRRKRLWNMRPPSRVWVLSPRASFFPAGDNRTKGGTTAYAWFVWDKSYQGPPVLGWVP